jgi:hypothetical protein
LFAALAVAVNGVWHCFQGLGFFTERPACDLQDLGKAAVRGVV